MSDPSPSVLNADERAALAQLAYRLTGSTPDSEARIDACVVNVLRRMTVLGLAGFQDYLRYVVREPDEKAHLISALTIHHTTWFREAAHLETLRELARTAAESRSDQTFRVLSAGCSTGEEVYSIGLILESVRHQYKNFDYQIHGWDVDPISVKRARQAVYRMSAMEGIPRIYHSDLKIGSGPTQGFFTLNDPIRERTHFEQRSLLELADLQARDQRFAAVFCRNVLIYFKAEQVQLIIKQLIKRLEMRGVLILGHSEAVDAKAFGLEGLGHTVYRLPLVEASKLAAASRDPGRELPARMQEALSLRRPDLIVIGASTGGTDALARLLIDMPSDCPPIVVVQHIAHSFSQSFAERLASIAGLKAGHPLEGGLVKTGHLYMAWGDYHIVVRRQGSSFVLATHHEALRHSVRPSVDTLFESAARTGLRNIFAVLLTGMGKDGASGLLALRKAGAMTLTQDEESSVVYGMPAEAVALGASQKSGNPELLRAHLLRAIQMPLQEEDWKKSS